jgi:hypothetical protein
MPEILTTDFKSDATRLFVEDILSNNYYMMVSGINRLDSENSQFSKNEFLEKVLFGKKVYNDDVHFMIKYYPWQRDGVYTQYDDTVNLEDQNFYAVVGPTVNDTGDYRIFKCLFNNDGAKVSAPPAWNANTDNQIYQTADGYLWKYMYNLTEIEFDAYNSLGYIPIKGSFNVNPVANTGGGNVSDIFVTNADDNFGYRETTGSFFENPFNTGAVICNPDNALISQIFFYYYGQTLYVVNQNTGVSELFDITYYSYNTTNGRVEIRVGEGLGLTGRYRIFDTIVDGSGNTQYIFPGGATRFTILPKIKIDGDGSGAAGVPVIDSIGRIKSVTLLNRGSGYNNIVARVVDPLYDFNPTDPTRTDERAILRAILSPPDGHNQNLIDEFHCHRFGIYAYITGEDNLLIGANNTYSSVALVKNPEFRDANNNLIDANNTPAVFDNRIAITTNDHSYATINSIVHQLDSNNQVVFEATVHDIDYTSNTIFLAEYMGPYVNQPNTSNSLNLNLSLRNNTGQIIRINTPVANNVVVPTYTQRSGRIYFLEDFFALPRTINSREEFKFVMEF